MKAEGGGDDDGDAAAAAAAASDVSLGLKQAGWFTSWRSYELV